MVTCREVSHTARAPAGAPARDPCARGRALTISLACLVALLPLAGDAATVITEEDIARFGGSPADDGGADGDAAAPGTAPGCALLAPGSEQATTETCTACHGLVRTHPVDVDYARAAARAPTRLLPLADVVRAGGYLPDGQVRCVTCHDGASPWRYQLTLPPGAVPAPSVAAMRAEPASYPELRVLPPPPLPPGSDVTPTPLCRMCHAT